MIDLHNAIIVLHPEVAVIRGEIAYDINGNKVEYDLAVVEAKAIEIQAEEEVKQKEALNKLAALGLTPEDLQRILG